MSRRSVTLAALGAAALAAVPAYALMDTEPEAVVRSFAPSRRATVYRDVAVTTSETRFRKVPEMELLVQGRGPATSELSVDVSGGPVELRVLRLPRHALAPGVARFAPAEGSTSFSYDFLDPRRGGGIECRRYVVSWRSPTGAAVTLNQASLIVDYHFDDETRDGVRTACVD
ncbi:MAG: hypothetical protein M3134_10830 [Actinomycetota bacterium]|nr:hypothetical protein [Actinomycetota bacterium]